jgi:hypothetical protein
MPDSTGPAGWLALLHQLPAKPPYLRVKIWRRLQAIGAIPLKNAVHILPRGDACEAVLRELLDEIVAGGGEAVLIEARLIAGLGDTDLRAQFDAARDADYLEIADAARRLLETGPPSQAEIGRLQRRLAETTRLDFFAAHGRQTAEAAIRRLVEKRFDHPDVGRTEPGPPVDPADLRQRVWVTRRGVHVDRIASAWLIRRFIDPDAAFRFVDGGRHAAEPGELRFDMAAAEFTHEDDRCTFETLVARCGLGRDDALVAIAEIIHDLDVKDDKFGRPETIGLGALLNGICTATDDDMERIARGGDALDQFHAHFSSRKPLR